MSDLTPAQEEARDKAWELLKEHFEGVLLVFDTEAAEGTDRYCEMLYHGGPTVAIGLCERSKLRLMRRIEAEND